MISAPVFLSDMERMCSMLEHLRSLLLNADTGKHTSFLMARKEPVMGTIDEAIAHAEHLLCAVKRNSQQLPKFFGDSVDKAIDISQEDLIHTTPLDYSFTADFIEKLKRSESHTKAGKGTYPYDF